MPGIPIWLRRYFWSCPWEELLTLMPKTGYPFWLWIFGDFFCGERCARPILKIVLTVTITSCPVRQVEVKLLGSSDLHFTIINKSDVIEQVVT